MIENNSITTSKPNIINILLLALALLLQKVFAAVSIDLPISITLMWGVTILILFVCYHLTGKIAIPIYYSLCQLWIAAMLFFALVAAPMIIGYDYKLKRIAYEFIYYEVLFFCLLVGYNISKIKYSHFFLKSIAFASVGVASISVFTELFNISLFKKMFYLSGAGLRFSGIVGNPNDYLPITLIALAYFFVTKREKREIKFLAISILIFSIFAAGSKGGIVSLALYFSMILLKWFLTGNTNRKIVSLICISVLIAGMLVVFAFPEAVSSFLLAHTSTIPGAGRIIESLANPWKALSDSSSSRFQCWYGVYLVIKESLLLGVGIGGNSRILETMNYEYSYLTPHNLYLELIAQSGLIVGLVILIICIGIFKNSLKSQNEDTRILRHAMFLLLSNGLYFAANWSIAFWFAVGMLCFYANCGGKHVRDT